MYYYADTLNSPYKAGLTDGQEGMVITSVIQNELSGRYSSQVCMVSGGDIYTRHIRDGQFGSWVKNTTQEQLNYLEAAAAYVEDGDTAEKRTYAEGEFIVWKGSLYTVNSGGIPKDTAITGHVTYVTGGGFNALNSSLARFEVPITFVSGNTPESYTRLSISGGIAVLAFSVLANTTAGGWNNVASFASQYAPRTDVYNSVLDTDNPDSTYIAYVSASGILYIKGVINNKYIRGQISWVVKH